MLHARYVVNEYYISERVQFLLNSAVLYSCFMKGKCLQSQIQSRVVWYKYADISDVPTATILKLKKSCTYNQFFEGSTYFYQYKRCQNFEEDLL